MSEAHAAHTKVHDYHLVDPSPWPFLGAMSGLTLASGGVMYMHGNSIGGIVLTVGFLAVLGVMAGWWRDVIKESVHEKAHTGVVQIGLRMGMVLFIASEVMFFVAFFWAYFNAALFPTEAVGGVWPPEGIETFDPWHLPLMNTTILLLSGTTLTWAHHALRDGDNRTTVQMLAVTVGLGLFFSCVQAYEYSHAAFAFTDGVYASTFYMATGFHGFHVIVGTIFLAVCLRRAMLNQFSATKHIGFEAAAWYWHFVDVVWLFLFVSIYVWGH